MSVYDSMILFDTDICVELLRGNQKIIRKRKEFRGEVAIGFMTVSELYYGAANSVFSDENKYLVDRFLMTITCIQSDLDISVRFGRLKAGLKKKNILIPDADLFIAATTLEKADMLVTRNVKHFQRIKELKIENWLT